MIRPLVISFLVMLVGTGMIILAFQKRPSKMTKVGSSGFFVADCGGGGGV